MVPAESALGLGDGLGEKFRWYLALECSWWVGVGILCYRVQPTRAIMSTSVGAATVKRAGVWLQLWWPSRYEGIAALSSRVYNSSNGRTFGEWLLINKVLSPISFPLKIATANHLVNRRFTIGAVVPDPAVEADIFASKRCVQQRLTRHLSEAIPSGIVLRKQT